ncbi:CHAD domain-containing protein [Amycolatopsis balhimycina DSM 5908]|uniref:CHAD domain-containing protein n=1 Tax=Amycolatopsis balhimycina DSM 5908 TaxID=1081091 RepID=A0A428W4X0_AMYBA|nr:CHAD domain-containing protein [Amycolatopsis balhimycina]RSM38141.1 CHAD domain-containing protein [Amycolatopsis balhimycina DSM 5908]
MTATVTDTAFFDTDFLRLLRGGLALSVHAGDWRLDTPDGPVRFAGSDLGVPPALFRLLRAYTRDDELVPVAHLSGGGISRLREAVGDRIVAPARPPDGAARGVVLRHFRTQLAALAAADLAVRQGRPDAVHRMRVAARRLRGVLSAYSEVLGGRKLVREVSRSLRWLGGELAPARDTEVQWARSCPWADERSDAYSVALAEQAGAWTRCALDSRRYVQLMNALDVLEVVLAEEPRRKWRKAARRPAAKVLPGLLHIAATDVDERVARVSALPAGPERDHAVHDVRKAAKKAPLRAGGRRCEARSARVPGPARRVPGRRRRAGALARAGGPGRPGSRWRGCRGRPLCPSIACGVARATRGPSSFVDVIPRRDVSPHDR